MFEVDWLREPGLETCQSYVPALLGYLLPGYLSTYLRNYTTIVVKLMRCVATLYCIRRPDETAKCK